MFLVLYIDNLLICQGQELIWLLERQSCMKPVQLANQSTSSLLMTKTRSMAEVIVHCFISIEFWKQTYCAWCGKWGHHHRKCWERYEKYVLCGCPYYDSDQCFKGWNDASFICSQSDGQHFDSKYCKNLNYYSERVFLEADYSSPYYRIANMKDNYAICFFNDAVFLDVPPNEDVRQIVNMLMANMRN